MPPGCRAVAWLTGSGSPDWRLFIGGGFERQVELLPSHLTTLSEFFVDQSCVILAIWHFQEPPRAATTLRNSLVLLKLADGFVFSIPRGEKVRFLFRFKARGSCYFWC